MIWADKARLAVKPHARRAADARRKFTEIYGNPRAGAARAMRWFPAAQMYSTSVYTIYSILVYTSILNLVPATLNLFKSCILNLVHIPYVYIYTKFSDLAPALSTLGGGGYGDSPRAHDKGRMLWPRLNEKDQGLRIHACNTLPVTYRNFTELSTASVSQRR